MPAVTAIANAPQNPTLSAGLTTGAPPAQAPSAPSATRKANAAAGTTMTTASLGERYAASVGVAAPTEKATAEARAASIGFGAAPSTKPSSSRAWAASASLAMS